MNWHEDPNGLCFIVMGPIESFGMGDRRNLEDESADDIDKTMLGESAATPFDCQIPRRFGVAMTEVSERDFLAWRTAVIQLMEEELAAIDEAADPAAHGKLSRKIRRVKRADLDLPRVGNPEAPIVSVSWDQAIAYCEFLSKESGLSSDQRCYTNEDGTEDYGYRGSATINRSGYRLPTEAEWEFICRAQSTTSRHVGRSTRWLNKYDWTIENSFNLGQAAGTLKPNAFGGHDFHGNASEWCDDDEPRVFDDFPEEVVVDKGGPSPGEPPYREIRGGSYRDEHERTTSYLRDQDSVLQLYPWRGFRVARTYPPQG